MVSSSGVISPLLFKLQIEDMVVYFGDVAGVNIWDTNMNHLLQADDIILISQIQTSLQSLLN